MTGTGKQWKKDNKKKQKRFDQEVEDNRTKPKDNKEIKNMIMQFSSIIIAFLALGVSVFTLINSINWQHTERNYNSYFEPLNYTVEVEAAADNYQRKNTVLFEGANPFASQHIILSPYSGAIASANVIYFYENKTYAVRRLELMGEVDRESKKSDELVTAILDFTQYAYAKRPASTNWSEQGYKESYYTCIYLAVEDFNHDVDLRLVVFEYPIGADGNITGEYDYREYPEIYQLIGTDANDTDVPDFDKGLMDDFRILVGFVDDILE